ncbi:AbrB/MazE/SpoVT family DNA-binding domain-containing protein [Patescibacteria group bacterium]|nr:AbrB/MazE/SpoVT family DNA-binding domain-containing protein [Patescibacteria group bacterium]
MTYLMTVTSQGQISIPAVLRRDLNIKAGHTLTANRTSDGGIHIKPVIDLLELGGLFKTKKKFTSQEIREGFGQYMAKRHLKNRPFPHVSP